jgi:hypothetical protein
MWIFGWIILSIVCASIGSDRNIGAVGAFFASIFLSPIIGFILVLTSDKVKPIQPSKWKALVEEAEIEKYKGKKEIAIDKYKEAMYWLEKEIEKNKSNREYKDRLDGLKMIVKKLESES